MCINEIIISRYNNIINIYKMKCINIMYIYKMKYMRKCIHVVIIFLKYNMTFFKKIKFYYKQKLTSILSSYKIYMIYT